VISGKKVEGEKNAVEVKQKNLAAAKSLYDRSIINGEGFATSDGKDASAEDLIKFLSPLTKSSVIDYALATAVEGLNLEKSSAKFVIGVENTATYKLTCHFSDDEIETTHTIAADNAEEESNFNAIDDQSYFVKGTSLGKSDRVLPSRAEAYGRLYDRIKRSVTGYVDDVVPLHHKRAIVEFHFGNRKRLSQGK
jgi:hypothetical protein